MFRSKLFLWVCLSSFVQPLAADPLRLDAVLSAVQAKNPDVLAAQAHVDLAQAHAKGVGAWKDPMLALEWMDLGAPSMDGLSQRKRLSLEQELPFPGVADKREQVALHAARRSQAMARMLLDQRLEEARHRYAVLWATAQAEQARAKSLQALQELSQLSSARSRLGRLDRMGQLMDALLRSRLAELQSAAPRLKQQRLEAEAALNVLMGEEPGRGLPDPDPALLPLPEALSFEQAWQRALAANAELEESRHHLEHTQAMQREAQAGWWPELGLELGLEEGPLGERSGSVKGGLSLPWVWSSRQRASVTGAAAETRHSQAELEGARLRVAQELRAKLAERQALAEELSLLRDKVLPASEEALSLALAGFRSGSLGADQALMAVMGYWEHAEGAAMLSARMQEVAATLERVMGTRKLSPTKEMSHD